MHQVHVKMEVFFVITTSTPTPKKGGSPKKKKQTKDRSRTPENRPSSSRTRQQPAPKSAKSSPKQVFTETFSLYNLISVFTKSSNI